MKIKWKKYITRENADLITTAEVDVAFFKAIEKFLKIKKGALFTYFTDNNFIHYITFDSYILGKHIFNRHFSTSHKIIKYYNRGMKWWKKEENSSLNWQNKLNKELSQKNLLKAFYAFRKSFKTINYVFSVPPYIAIEAWQHDLDRVLNNLIQKNRLQENREEILTSIYKPWKKTSLLEIEGKIKKGIPIKKILKDYQFLRSWTAVWYRPIEREWTESFVKPESSKIKIKKLSKSELIKILKPNKKERNFLELTPYVIFIKDWRDDIRRRHAYAWHFLFDDIAKNYKVDFKDLGYFTLDELGQCLKKDKLDINIITRRKKHSCVIIKAGDQLKVRILEGSGIKKYGRIVKEIEKYKKSPTIKGLIAQPGYAKGIVKIFKSYHDIKHIKMGDILVAATTHPNYLPAMKKAAAFITDEGGIASHAAIVAREFKKPCIVGTKIATRVLNDGDLVEVDANNGVIRILK